MRTGTQWHVACVSSLLDMSLIELKRIAAMDTYMPSQTYLLDLIANRWFDNIVFIIELKRSTIYLANKQLLLHLHKY